MKKIFLQILMICLVVPAFAQLNMTLRSEVQFSNGLNDIWGWQDPDTGIEYALVGRRDGVSIVSLEDVDNAQEVQFIPGPNSTWRDLKTWGSHCYVTNETSNGVLVIDLSKLPNEAPFFEWTPDIPDLGGAISSCHNLYIDERGICYLAGCNINRGGLIYVDVVTNLGQPEVIGWNEPQYSHDVFVRDGIIYDSQINNGVLAIYDHTDLTQTIRLGTQRTPFSFTHNAWLSDDSRVVFTTDERPNAPVAAYDISDPTDIEFLDEFRPIASLDRSVVPHNVHVWDDWLLISYYTDGGIVVDASRPENLIEVGNFDTFLGTDGGTNGAWGLYPFLPSGTVLVTDVDNGLYVLTPNLVRACWLEGTVTEMGSGIELSDVKVEIDVAQANQGSTDASGEYTTGIATAGTYEVTFSKFGYKEKTVSAILDNGVVTTLDVELEKLSRINISGTVTRSDNDQPIEGASLSFSNSLGSFDIFTDANGNFSTEEFPGDYVIFVDKWGYKTIELEESVDATPINAQLDFGYQDDFETDLGWTATTDGRAASGFWVRDVPNATFFDGNISNIGEDLPSDFGTKCYVTGNDVGRAGDDDVDDGMVTLTSPVMDLTQYADPNINFSYYFFNASGQGTPNDSVRFFMNNGIEEIGILTFTQSVQNWQPVVFRIADHITITDNMTFSVAASDFNPGHLVEAAFDGFFVEENLSSTKNLLQNVSLEAFPNPFEQNFTFKYQLENNDANLLITNLLGQQIESHRLIGAHGNIQLGNDWISGVYFAKITQDGKTSEVLKIVKQ